MGNLVNPLKFSVDQVSPWITLDHLSISPVWSGDINFIWYILNIVVHKFSILTNLISKS